MDERKLNKMSCCARLYGNLTNIYATLNCVTLESTLHVTAQQTDRKRRYEDNSVQETVAGDYYKPSGQLSDAPLH